MKRALKIILAVSACWMLSACAVKTYPRPVTAKEKAFTNIAWSIDTSLARSVSSLYEPVFGLDEQMARVDYSYYLDESFREDPRSFYPKPAGPPEFELKEKIDETEDVEVFFLKWKSAYRPMNPDFEEMNSQYTENHWAYGVYVKSKTPNRGAIIWSHGWANLDVRREYKTENAIDYASRGYDCVLLQQPYHGPRKPEGSAFTGELFFSGEVSRLNEAFCQTITDLRAVLMWLRQSYDVVGAKGESLGGITTLLAAAVEDDLDFAVAWIPPGSMGDLSFDSALVGFVAKGMTESGLDREKAGEILYVSSPVNFEPAIPEEDILIIAGMGDSFVPPDQPLRMLEAWEGIEAVWFSGGHALNFQKRLCLQKEAEFLRERLKR